MTRGFFESNYEFLHKILPSYLMSNSTFTPSASISVDDKNDLLSALLDTAQICHERLDYVGELSAIRAAFKTGTRNPNTRRRLTVVLLSMCEWEAAIASCDAEIVLCPDDPCPRLLAAYLLAHTGQFDHARVYVERGLQRATQKGLAELRTDFFILSRRLGMDEQNTLEFMRQLTASADETNFTAQFNNTTEINRYPEIFALVEELTKDKMPNELKILSFGCSIGKEPYTLATKYFRGASIIAVDVSADAINIAKRENSIAGVIHYDFSSPENIEKYGRYDIIFAMSVLCRWPDLATESDANSIFPFHKYLEIVTVLHKNLRRGGLLIIYNSNYDFSYVDFFDEYEIVLTPAITSNGYVKHFDKSCIEIPTYSGTELIYRKLMFTTKS